MVVNKKLVTFEHFLGLLKENDNKKKKKTFHVLTFVFVSSWCFFSGRYTKAPRLVEDSARVSSEVEVCWLPEQPAGST